MKSQKPEIIVLETAELEEILRKAMGSPLDEKNIKTLRAMGETLVWVTGELEKKRVDIRRLRDILFGTNNSEKTSEVLGKENEDKTGDSQSGDAEEDQDKEKGKDGKEGKKPKPKGHGRNGADSYTGATRIKVPHEELSSGDICPDCEKGKVYVLPEPRTVVRVTGRAPIDATVYEAETLRCNLCGRVFVAKMPADAYKKKYDEESAAMIALLKYGNGMPFNRLRVLEGNLGIPLPASVQWQIVEEASKIYYAVYYELIRQAAQAPVIYVDDTGIIVLSLMQENVQIEAAEGNSKSRTGMFTSGIVATQEGRQIALFFTGRKHAGENIADVLKERASQLGPPLQMCDAASRNVPVDFLTLLAFCLAHGRRKFVEIVDYFPEQCRYVLEALQVVYKHDAHTRRLKMTDQERLRYHQVHSTVIMNDLQCWMTDQIEAKKVEPNSSLGGAINYMLKRWDNFTLFLREPGAPLDNNICERALKTVIRHRNSSLFFKTENGAAVADICMSLIHTTELGGGNPFDYLTVLLKHAKDAQCDPHLWMPWNYQETATAKAKASQ